MYSRRAVFFAEAIAQRGRAVLPCASSASPQLVDLLVEGPWPRRHTAGLFLFNQGLLATQIRPCSHSFANNGSGDLLTRMRTGPVLQERRGHFLLPRKPRPAGLVHLSRIGDANE